MKQKNSDKRLESIQENVTQNSDAINYIIGMTQPKISLSPQIPRLIIARKWNSWYPSYFDVKGGGYVLDFGTDKIAIDPGFQFTGIIRELKINPLNVTMIFLTHLHPDHFAGLIEFMTVRHELETESNEKITIPPLLMYANEACFNFFKSIISGNIILNVELKQPVLIL